MWGGQSREDGEAGTWYSSLRGRVCGGMLWALGDLDGSRESFLGGHQSPASWGTKGCATSLQQVQDLYCSWSFNHWHTALQINFIWPWLKLLNGQNWLAIPPLAIIRNSVLLRPLTHIWGFLFCFWKIPLLQALAISRKMKVSENWLSLNFSHCLVWS